MLLQNPPTSLQQSEQLLNQNPTSMPNRIRWEKVDKCQYLNQTNLHLQALVKNLHRIPVSIITEWVNSILTDCVCAASPAQPKRIRKTKFKWRPSLYQAARKATKAYRHLKSLHDNDPIYATRKASLRAAKKSLRKAQWQLAAK